jgi:hypothetical protein
MKNVRFRRMAPLVLLLAATPGFLYADCASPSGSYEVMACRTTAAFASKHLARDVSEAQTRAVARGSRSTFLQPNSVNSNYIRDIYNSANVERCLSRAMQIWDCSYNATSRTSTCTALTRTVYFSKYTTGRGGTGKIYHLDSDATATQYGTLGTCTFR